MISALWLIPIGLFLLCLIFNRIGDGPNIFMVLSAACFIAAVWSAIWIVTQPH